MRLVMAGNYYQFRDFLRRSELSTTDHRYVTTQEQLRGYSGEVLQVGTWWDNQGYTSNFLDELDRRVNAGRIAVEEMFE
jgi:hypothetical protein